MKLNGFFVILVITLSTLTGLLIPGLTTYLSSIMLYGVMMSLFLSFLPLDFKPLIQNIWKEKQSILWYTFAHLILFPSISYNIFLLIAPNHALSVLLLTGASAAAPAPFMAFLLNANTGLYSLPTFTI